MFGQRNDQSTQTDNTELTDESAHAMVGSDEPAQDASTQVDDHQVEAPSSDHNDPVATDDNSWQHPGAPIDDNQPSEDKDTNPAPISDVVTPNGPAASAPTYHAPTPSHDNNDADDLLSADDPELIEIRQKALGELSPLMEHLDQAPEEKFRTTMMMIQSNDDQKLIKAAYEAAKQITDDKIRAQALLDIVNEINYFTTQHAG